MCIVTVLRVSVIYVLPYRPVLVNLEPTSKTTFLLPASLLASLHPRLCGALLVAKMTHVSIGADARPFLNSTAPLSSNLTVLEFGTVCANKVVMVRLCRTCCLANALTPVPSSDGCPHST